MTNSRTSGAVAALVTFLAALLAILVVTGVTPLSADTGSDQDGDTAAVHEAAGSAADTGTDATAGGVPAGGGTTAAGTATSGDAQKVADTATPGTTQDGRVSVELVGTEPAVARPGEKVTFTVRITNGRERAISSGHVDLGVHWRPLTSRDDLAAWARDAGTSTTVARQLSADVATIPPGESVRKEVELDVDILDLSADAPWGPREMSLSLVDGSGATLDVLHTFLLFAPEDTAPDPVGVSVLAPLTGPAVQADEVGRATYADELSDLTADDGRFTSLADAGTPTDASPGITLAADPAVVATAQESDDTTTVDWATRLTDGDVGEVVPLPALDPDLATLAHADLTSDEIADATGGLSALTDWQTPETWGPTLAWPQGRPDLATMNAGRMAGADHVVANSGLAPVDGSPASARTAVTTPSGKVSALAADGHLSAVVGSLTTGDDAPTSAEAAQQLLADTALLAAERQRAGGGPVNLLAAAPRGWSPDATTLHEVLGALDDADWSDVVPLAETVDTPTTDTPRAQLPASAPADDELAPKTVRRLADTRSSVTAFSSVADDPDALASDVTQALVAPLSVAYRGSPAAREDAVGTAIEEAETLQQGISIADRTAVTLISDNAEIPVVVRNDLPMDATVTVVLHPDDPRLKIESRPTVDVPAGMSTNVPVDVRAIGSGNVTIQVEALAPSGVSAAEPGSFDVRVRAGWETVGTAVVAAAIGILFLAGIWRSVRRARARRSADGTDGTSQPSKDDKDESV